MESVSELRAAVGSYLQAQDADASAPVTVHAIEQMPGGASRSTYRVEYGRRGEAATSAVLRMIPASGGFTSDNVAKEVQIFEALADRGLPIPRVRFWSDDPSWLGGPFLIIDEVAGCEASLSALFEPPFGDVRREIGQQIWTYLGVLAAMDPVELGLIDPKDVPSPEDVWKLERDYVASTLSAGGCEADPLAQYLVDWLEDHVPPPGRLSIVHGDYRPGNLLFNEDGDVPLIMDWELWRLGDSLFDLVYSIRSTWAGPGGEHVLPVDEAIALWEQGSGRRIDAESRTWYEVAERAAGFGTLAQMRDEYFRTGGRESLTYFFTLRSLSSTWERLRTVVGLPEPTVRRTVSRGGAAGERLVEYASLAAERLRTSVADAIDDHSLRSGVQTDGLILRVVADRLENGIQLLADDNAELERAIAAAAGLIDDADLAAEFSRVLSAGDDGSLVLSDLEARNSELCAAMVKARRALPSGAGAATTRALDTIALAISNHCERLVLPLELFR